MCALKVLYNKETTSSFFSYLMTWYFDTKKEESPRIRWKSVREEKKKTSKKISFIPHGFISNYERDKLLLQS